MDATVAAAKVLRAGGDDIIAGAAKDAKNLRLDQIEPDPDQPRVEFDGKAMAILVKDIQKRGVLQPILVSPPATEDGKYLIIAGERR
ncbi:MAG: chromosome partitioning protein ParB, partial [Proteobacteria bacterium]